MHPGRAFAGEVSAGAKPIFRKVWEIQKPFFKRFLAGFGAAPQIKASPPQQAADEVAVAHAAVGDVDEVGADHLPDFVVGKEGGN